MASAGESNLFATCGSTIAVWRAGAGGIAAVPEAEFAPHSGRVNNTRWNHNGSLRQRRINQAVPFTGVLAWGSGFER